jgi:predicted small integral membrane protein
MLLVLALIVLVVFAGLGFVAKVLWWGLIIGLVLAVAHVVQSGLARRP